MDYTHSQERLDNYNEVMALLKGNTQFISPDKNNSDFSVLSVDEILRLDGILYIGSVTGENPLTDVIFHSIKKNLLGKTSIKFIDNAALNQKLYELYKQENEYRYDFENNCIRPEYLRRQESEKSCFIPEWAYGILPENKLVFILRDYIQHVMQIEDRQWLMGVCQFLLQTCIENGWEVDVETLTGKKMDTDEFCEWFANFIEITFAKLLESGKGAVVYLFDKNIRVSFINADD